MVTVHELRKNGCSVKIKHVREFCGIHKVEEYDNFMTRGEYENARLNGELRFDEWGLNFFYQDEYDVAQGKMPSYGKAVYSDGGWTEVVITTPEGKVLKGKHSFNGKSFCKKLGLRAAIGKAIIGSERDEKRKQKEVK